MVSHLGEGDGRRGYRGQWARCPVKMEYGMSATSNTDAWVSGERYEPYIGRWSRLVARQFLAWLDVPPDRTWLDAGCGTGALTHTILEQAAPGAVTGIDLS